MVECLTYLSLHSSIDGAWTFRFLCLEGFSIWFASNCAINSIWSVPLTCSTGFTLGFLIYYTLNIDCIEIDGTLVFLIASSYWLCPGVLLFIFINTCLAGIHSILSAFSWEILSNHISSIELSSSCSFSHGVEHLRTLEVGMLELRILLSPYRRLRLCDGWCFTWRHLEIKVICITNERRGRLSAVSESAATTAT